MELLILFDRDDRLYRFGEVISGKVVLVADLACTYSEIWITYQWRTHGRGNRDQGVEEKLSLTTDKVFCSTGERKEFPFHIAAPNGPVTYHGYLLNVDWYLTAQARSGAFGHFKSEQDFLLQAGDPTGTVILGNKEVPREELPAYPTNELPASHGLLEMQAGAVQSPRLISEVVTRAWQPLGFALVALISAILLGPYLDWNFETAFVVAILILTLVGVIAQILVNNAYRRKLKIGEVRVQPDRVYCGSEVYCHVDFVAKREIHLRAVKASISIQERITRTAGTTTETEIHVIDEKIHTRTFNEDLIEGRWFAFDCALPVESDAPATFSSNNSALEWTVMMKAELRGWPAWQKTFPITVLPYTFADQ